MRAKRFEARRSGAPVRVFGPVGVALVACSCYVGVDAPLGHDPQAGGSSAQDDDAPPGPKPDIPDEPELGDCDPETLTTSTLRRLNRREYRNTVTDLLGVAQLPELALPWDTLNSLGLDNDGATLTLDIAGADAYYDAAEAIAATVVGGDATVLAACADASDAALRACVDAGLDDWLHRAFRRPVPEGATEALRGLLDDRSTYLEIVETLVIFSLTSPHFLFHYKATGDGDDEYEIADRLAYLLWSSTPDAELLDAAQAGVLGHSDALEAHVERMLDDPRAGRFYADFTGLWLELGLLDEKPDAQLHADLFDDMRYETIAFFEHVATSGAAVGTLLDSDRSVINGRLADHYGIDVELGDDEWELTPLPPEQRAGLLTQGSLLAASSGIDFSDPIRRGSWVAQQIACSRPPPPPFEPPELPDPEEVDADTVRELLEKHRSDPACAGCHALMDPYGLALENYDRLGLYRTAYDDGEPIDPSGRLVNGIVFENAVDLGRQLAQEDEFALCFATYLSAYGMARVLSDDEACFVELAVDAARARADELSIDAMLVTFVTSYLFAATGGDA